jgi:hypothetical protein
MAPDITGPTVRITNPSLPRQTIIIQGTARDNLNPGGSRIRDVYSKVNISGTYKIDTPSAPRD